MKMTHRIINRRLAIIAGVVESEGLNYTTTKLVMSGGRTVVSIRGAGWSSLEFYVEDYSINSYQMSPTGMTVEGLREGMKNFEVVLGAFSRCVKLINELEALEGFDWFSIDTDPVVSPAHAESLISDTRFAGLNWGHYWAPVSKGHLIIRDLIKAGYSVTMPLQGERGITEAEFAQLRDSWKGLS